MNSSHLQGRALRGATWLATAVLVFSYVLTALIYQSTPVQAAEVTSRSIQMSTSQEGATATYTVSFTVPDTGAENIGSFRVEFCNNDPLPGTTCTETGGDNVPDLDSASLDSATFDDTGGTDECTTVSLAAVTAGDRYLDFTCDVVDDISAAGDFTATVSGIVNPSNATESPANPNNTFYARLYVYTATTPTAIANPVTGHVHDGGIAMSTAEQLTITARVQEVLEFCVGDDNNTFSNGDCTDISGNDIDLGVLDFSGFNQASVEDSNGYAMLRTNASSGVVIEYFANNGNANDNGDAGTEDDGYLAVNGQNCDFPASTTDQCINDIGATAEVIDASDNGTEKFGMAVTSVDTSAGGLTSNVVADPDYDYTGGNEWAFLGTGATDTLATSSNTVVDDETLVLDWTGGAAITTPTGVYSTVLTFIATATF